MFKSRGIDKKARVVEHLDSGPLIEISFKGSHRDGCGDELIAYVRKTVQELKPAAVIMNLINFKYAWGDDIGALLTPLLDEKIGKCRPFCIIASGRTARSLKSLFKLTMFPDFVNAQYFDDVQRGLEYLKKELTRDSL